MAKFRTITETARPFDPSIVELVPVGRRGKTRGSRTQIDSTQRSSGSLGNREIGAIGRRNGMTDETARGGSDKSSYCGSATDLPEEGQDLQRKLSHFCDSIM